MSIIRGSSELSCTVEATKAGVGSRTARLGTLSDESAELGLPDLSDLPVSVSDIMCVAPVLMMIVNS